MTPEPTELPPKSAKDGWKKKFAWLPFRTYSPTDDRIIWVWLKEYWLYIEEVVSLERPSV